VKITKREKRNRYVKFFKMFEKGLKEYDEIFKNDNYILNYVICRDYFGQEDEIKIYFKIHPQNFEGGPKYGQFSLLKTLHNYCRIFSIEKIAILKSLRVEREGRNASRNGLKLLKIEDRIFFEYFRMIDKYVEIR